jgi:beta-phosphoglucomutase family hydrolase
MTNRSPTAVIWDMDGVIVDTGIYHFRSWQYAFQQEGKLFTEEDFKHIFGQRNDTNIRNMLGENITQSKIEAVSAVKEEYFRQSIGDGLKPFPGVLRMLNILKENSIAAAIASSAPLENIELILRNLAIRDYFQAIVFGKEVNEGKPSPQVFLLAAKKLEVEPFRCIVIEDAVAGVTGAKRAGMKCIAVTNTHSSDKLSEADLIVDSLQKVGLNEIEALLN